MNTYLVIVDWPNEVEKYIAHGDSPDDAIKNIQDKYFSLPISSELHFEAIEVSISYFVSRARKVY